MLLTYRVNYNATTQRLTSETHPETGTTSYTYNADGTLATKGTTSYTYDAYKRVTSRTVSGQSCQTVNYYYDSNTFDGSFTQNGWGRLTAVEYKSPLESGCELWQGGTKLIEMYSYTAAGLVAKKRLRVIKDAIPPDQYNPTTNDLDVTYSYDTEGRQTRVTYPDGKRYQQVRDTLGRPVGLNEVDSNGNVVKAWASGGEYGAAGQMLRLGLQNVTSESIAWQALSYNARLQVTQFTHGSTVTLYYYSGTENNGRITGRQKLGYPDQRVNYSYDMLNRLVGAETVGNYWGSTYGYDGFGNLTEKVVTKGSAPTLSVVVNKTTNRLATAGFLYDDRGNLTQTPGGGLVMAYDGQNRVTRVTTASGTEYYGYAGDNRRVWKKDTSGQEWIYLYGAYGEKMGEYHLEPWALGVTLGEVRKAVEFAGYRLWKGGAIQGWEQAAPVSPEESGYPYGEGKSQGYATYETDGTGLDYAWNRYYHSTYGRFTSADPYVSPRAMTNPQGWNRYPYVEGDPVNFVDPQGLFVCTAGDAENGPFCPSSGAIRNDGGGDSSYAAEGKVPWARDRQEAMRAKKAALALAQSYLADAASLAKKAITDPDCFGLFGSRADGTPAAQVLSGMLTGAAYGNIEFIYNPNDIFVATTRPAVSPRNLLGVTSTVTKINAREGNGYWNKGDSAENANTILHELGHVLRFLGFRGGDFVQSDGDRDVNLKNSALITEKCL